MIFEIAIGDYSGDGHEKSEHYHVSTVALSIEEVREAYFAAKKLYPRLCPENFCSDYEDSSVPVDIIAKAAKLGYVFSPTDFWAYEMAEYTVWFLNLGNPDLKFAMSEQDSVPTLNMYGYDEKKRHIGGIGYGLFL